MAALASGVLLKLLDGMKSGNPKPVGDHRTAVLQVTDIVPADLDEKDLWPRHGFYIKVSDSSHSIYASLPFGQDDLVLSNKMQLGQFLLVDRLDPGSPVPVIIGAKILPGRHPLIGTPEPIAKAKVAVGASRSGQRRGSWGPESNIAGVLASPKVVKPTALNFEDETPGKMTGGRIDGGSASVRKSIAVSMFTRSRTVAEKERKAPKQESFSPSIAKSIPRLRSMAITDGAPPSPPSRISDAPQSSIHLPGKLGVLGKEAMQQRETAQKAALQALRNASAADNVVRILKVFSELSRAARSDSPAACFDQFLSFHKEAAQAVADMETIHAATYLAAAGESDDTTVLRELAPNCSSQNEKAPACPSKRKALSSVSEQSEPKTEAVKRKSSTAAAAASKTSDDGNEKASTSSTLLSSVRMAKRIQREAAQWFMEFLEAALEPGAKRPRGNSAATAPGTAGSGTWAPQSVILRVINWLEMEQIDAGSKRPIHPRAAQIARKLRIKAKNP